MHKRQFVLALLLFLLLFLVLNFVNAQTIQDYNLTYDANGNMIQGFGEYIEYDAWNRLSKIRNTNATGTVIAEYLYDHEGNRIKKIVYNSNGDGHNESTYYMNTRPADFIQVINTNGTILNETYIYLQDKLIAKYDTQGEKFFYHPDHLGSTSLVTNESGDVVEDLLYLPYGDILSGTEISRFGYTGQENDVESGFIDYGARQYNPQFGRFLQPDPIISDIYNPQNLNRYSYVLNNPYKYTDETGENPLLITAAVGAAIGATSSIVVQYANTGQVNWGSVGISAAGGAIAGATGFGVGTLVAQAIGSSTAAVAISGALAGATAGETGALAESLFTNKDYIFDPARVITNAVIGGIAGTISGKVSNSNSATSNLNKNTINHIMQDKHNWGDVVDDPKDWKQVQGVIDRTIKEGKISKEGSTSGVYSSTSNINGNNIVYSIFV